jgi:hypothetical protein
VLVSVSPDFLFTVSWLLARNQLFSVEAAPSFTVFAVESAATVLLFSA